MTNNLLIQALIPISISLLGISIWYWDFGIHRFDIKETLKSLKGSNSSVRLESQYYKFRKKTVITLQTIDDNRQIHKRLGELGLSSQIDYGSYRFEQLSLTAVMSAIPFIALLFMQISFVSALLLSFVFALATYFFYDRSLTLRVRNRRLQIESEFPALIEMLTLSIAAGETPIAAMSRVCRRSKSLLAGEFSMVLQEVQAGKPFHEALDDLGRSLQSASIRRFIDALVLAMVRGAPVVEVLHRHVAEARINYRNLIMDKAGKAETLMMIPIVFLILPISVLFALWPSINQLSLFTS